MDTFVNEPAVRFDIVLRGGTVVDTTTALNGRSDVGIRFGRVAALAPTLPAGSAAIELDVHNCLVTPGLIDLHAHVYTGVTALAIPADEVCASSGVTCLVDAGSAGAHTLAGFRRLIIDSQQTRVLAFCHISTIGLSGWPVGEMREIRYADVAAAVRAVHAQRDACVGIKVRQSAGRATDIVGENGLTPLQRAVAAATELGCPVMVHIGNAPGTLATLLDLLRPGDIVTHCFTGLQNGLIGADDCLDPASDEARRRGILFDVGHGAGSCSFAVSRAALRAGFLPDTISTDLHSLSINQPVVDMPTTMTKYLELGMSFAEVLERVTTRPAAWLCAALPMRQDLTDLGSLRVGAPADVAVLEWREEPTVLRDAAGDTLSSTRRLVARHTIRAGRLWGRPYAEPPRVAADDRPVK